MGRSVPRKPKNDIFKEAPKMFYTPNELSSDLEYMKLAFSNQNIVSPYIADGSIEPGMIMFTIVYKKIYIKNAQFPYLMVDENQVDKFLEYYLGESPKEIKEKRKYI